MRLSADLGAVAISHNVLHVHEYLMKHNLAMPRHISPTTALKRFSLCSIEAAQVALARTLTEIFVKPHRAWQSHWKVATHPKKKRKSDGEGGLPLLVLGTQAGAVVVYSVAEGGIVSSLNDGHKSAVQCLAWESGADLFTCSTDNFVHWDVKNKTVRRKWRNGEACSAMAVSPDGEMLITASRSIKWWSVEKRTVIRTFTGHATPVIRLAFLTSLSGDNYVISAAQKDRLVNAW
ncbi:WD repeat-containing protein 43 [Homalodisca vitripennis]|nr:WD repeat-containing protein 43 [Homalodisca vitripennis]